MSTTTDPSDEALIQAVEAGNYELLEHLLKLRSRPKAGLPPLNLSALLRRAVASSEVTGNQGRVQCARLLINSGADVNCSCLHFGLLNSRSQAPLVSAAERGNLDMVSLLLDSGAFTAVSSVDGNTALCHACRIGHHKIVKRLLDSNADVNHKNEEGWTPLMLACKRGDSQIVESLLDATDIDVNAFSNFRTTTALMLAHANDYITQVLVERGADVNQRNCRGQTALDVAVSNPNVPIRVVETLLQHGALLVEDSERKELSDDVTPLIAAVANGRRDIVKVMLAVGADVNQSTDAGITPLMKACMTPQVDFYLIRLLLNSPGLEIDATDSTGRTALHCSVFETKPNPDLVTLLLDRGADIDRSTKGGFTPLQGALVRNCKDVTRVLLKRGADPNKRDAHGITPLSTALFWIKSDTWFVETLYQAGVRITFELHQAVYLRNAPVVEKMIECGAMPRLVSLHHHLQHFPELSYPVSPLFVALYRADLELSSFIVNSGFLIHFDLYELHKKYELRLHLLTKNKTKALSYLDSLRLRVPSLWTISFVAASTLLGFGVERETNVSRSGLPGPLQDRLMFRNLDTRTIHPENTVACPTPTQAELTTDTDETINELNVAFASKLHL